MAAFPELKRALFAWVNEAIDQLSHDNAARDYTTDLGHWRCDSDGVFRDRERIIDVWKRTAVNSLFELPSWTAVLDVLHEDSRLYDQADAFIGTLQGGHQFEATSIGRRVLPRPNELDRLTEVFEERYEEFDIFFATNMIEYIAVWPLPGLTCTMLPLQLEFAVELDAMSDRELGMALDTEIVRTTFPRERLFNPGTEHRTCLRYRYSLPKVVGDINRDKMLHDGEQRQRTLLEIESRLKEALALILPGAVNVAGSFGVISRPESPLGGAVGFQQATVPQGPRLRRAHMSNAQASELKEIWHLLCRPGLLKRNKGLALAIRRLSYQAQREQAEDELLDTMIAAEALYLTGMSKAADRGELRYRLSLRAALWADPEQVGFTKREVFSIMKSVYDTRSAIAHGGAPQSEDMKVRGQKVPLEELARTAKAIIVAGCRAALTEATFPEGKWPPDWDGTALGDLPGDQRRRSY